MAILSGMEMQLLQIGIAFSAEGIKTVKIDSIVSLVEGLQRRLAATPRRATRAPPRTDIRPQDRFDLRYGDRDAKFITDDGILIWQGTSLRTITGVTAGADVVIIQAITTVSGEQLVRVEVISRSGSRDGTVGWMPSRYLGTKMVGERCFAKFGGLGSRRVQRCEGR